MTKITVIRNSGYMSPWFHNNDNYKEDEIIFTENNGTTPSMSFHMHRKHREGIVFNGENYEIKIGNARLYNFKQHPEGFGICFDIQETYEDIEEYGEIELWRTIDAILSGTSLHKEFFPNGSFEVTEDVVIDHINETVTYKGMTVPYKNARDRYYERFG